GGTAAWLLTDRLGSVRLVTDGSGVEKDRIGYGAYGKVTSESDATWGGRFKYTGQESEDGLSQQRHHWRWYDLESGQWTSEDPYGFAAGDYNLKRYVGNGPTNATDPSGLELLAYKERTAREYLTWLSGKGSSKGRYDDILRDYRKVSPRIKGLSVRQADSG